MESHELAAAVRKASDRPAVRLAVRELYQQTQEEVDKRRPTCAMSGRCCRFDEYGHRLYVTTMELAAFVHDVQAKPLENKGDGKGCPFQIGKLCSVHGNRPFGCRIFFCDATATQWQQDLYEQFHAKLKRLHELFAVPYGYVEWREALSQLGLA